MQSFSERFCTLTYEHEDYAEGIAKYRRCADQFSVNFTVAPKADVSSISTGGIAQCNITNLERCKVYDIFARFYRGDQVLDTVYDVDSVMTSKLSMASYRPCMYGIYDHDQYALRKVLPRVLIQCKHTPGMSYMYTHAHNHLLLR